MEFVRYKNRKIYSPEMSQYIVASEILKLALAGVRVSVRQNHTGEDVTKNVLAQALINHAPFVAQIDSTIQKLATPGMAAL